VDGTTGTVKIVKTEEKTLTMYNLDVANLDNFYVGEQGWLVHNSGPCIKLGQNYSFNRGQRQFTLTQGDSSSGWTHIWERHIDPVPGNLDFLTKTKFDSSLGETEIAQLLGETLKHGTETDFYGLPIFEYRTNFNGIGYKTYRVTVNFDGTILSFHPLE
jgi:hypothetical protein